MRHTTSRPPNTCRHVRRPTQSGPSHQTQGRQNQTCLRRTPCRHQHARAPRDIQRVERIRQSRPGDSVPTATPETRMHLHERHAAANMPVPYMTCGPRNTPRRIRDRAPQAPSRPKRNASSTNAMPSTTCPYPTRHSAHETHAAKRPRRAASHAAGKTTRGRAKSRATEDPADGHHAINNMLMCCTTCPRQRHVAEAADRTRTGPCRPKPNMSSTNAMLPTTCPCRTRHSAHETHAAKIIARRREPTPPNNRACLRRAPCHQQHAHVLHDMPAADTVGEIADRTRTGALASRNRICL